VNLAAAVPRSRYEMLVKIASGGMATVFVGRLLGALGFQQLVAIKRAHPHLADDESFRRMFLAEANLASRIHHANVVSVRDIEVVEDSIHLVMDYVEGVSLSELLSLSASAASREALARVGMRVLLDACAGLHAAHELSDDMGRTLGLVHRDVSPQNILVGVDGVGRVVDFGIAKCVHQRDGMSTSTGSVKGKTAYMAPEYLSGRVIDRRADVFAMGILFWEILADERLFRGQTDVETLSRVLMHVPAPVSAVAPFCGARMDAVIAAALARDPKARPATMLELAVSVEAAAGADLVAGHREVARLVEQVAGERLAARRARVRSLIGRRSDSGAHPELDASATELTAELAELAGVPRRSRLVTKAVGLVAVACAGFAALYAARAASGGTSRSAEAARVEATTAAPPETTAPPAVSSSVAGPVASKASAQESARPPAQAATETPARRAPRRAPHPSETAGAPSVRATATARPLPSNPYH
jgi:serine/threonine-protein kinase